MTFDRFGNLYAWSGGCSGGNDCNVAASDLFTIDTTTGAATKVGESATQGFQTGLASDSKGRMYMKDRPDSVPGQPVHRPRLLAP